MTRSTPVLACLLLIPCHALAQDDPEWRALAVAGFSIVDADGDGSATLAEQMAATAAIQASMDTDGDGALSEGEFTSWGFGMANLAEARGTLALYEAGLRTLFDLWDRDDDGRLSPAEHEHAAAQGFADADRDGDGRMSEGEYAGGFVYNVVSRQAVRVAEGAP